ncbi:MAG: nucleotidyltransferase family protein [Alkalispirochaetaceae bacterium]
MKPTLLVLAAGMGSRYGGVKQIDPVGLNGEALIDFSIYDALEHGFDRIVFVIRREIEGEVRQFFSGKFEERAEVLYVYQDLADLPGNYEVRAVREKPWGTAHAVWAARDVIRKPFAVINGDDFYGRDAFGVIAEYLDGMSSQSEDYTMVGYTLVNTLSENGTVSRGICDVDEEGYLTGIEEHTKIGRDEKGVIRSWDESGQIRATFTGQEICSMNMFGFAPPVMEHIGVGFSAFLESRGTEPKSEYYIPGVVQERIAEGSSRCRVLSSTARWFGITYREDKEGVVESVRQLQNDGTYPAPLWA